MRIELVALQHNDRMRGIRPGEPGHGGNSAVLRLRPVRIVNGVVQGGWTDRWEIICPACGDDAGLDYRGISPFLQRMRGSYASEQAGIAALREHRGLQALPAPARAVKPVDVPARAPATAGRS